MDTSYCTFYIVRHGQAELNRDNIVMGQIDSPLTALGEEQAKVLKTRFTAIKFDAVLVSDLQRAFNTARIITDSDGSNFQVESGLRERSFGSLEGKPQMELSILRERNKGLPPAQKWTIKLVKDMESDQEVFTRVNACLKSISKSHLNEKVLVVTHSGPIRTLLMGLGFYKKDELEPGFLGHGDYAILQLNESQTSLKGVYPGNASKLPSNE